MLRSLPGSAPSTLAPLAALFFGGQTRAGGTLVAETPNLAEGWWSFIINEAIVSFKLMLIEGDNVPSPQILLGGNKQNALERFRKGPPNEPLGIIPVRRGLAGGWEKCCFSLPFPQIAVSGKHLLAVSLGGGAVTPARDTAPRAPGAGAGGFGGECLPHSTLGGGGAVCTPGWAREPLVSLTMRLSSKSTGC